MNKTLLDEVVPQGKDQQSLNGPKYRGIFQFRFWQYGQFVNVTIDDLLPTTDGQLVTSNILLHVIVQAALVIRGLGIRGFDYPLVRKRGKTSNSKRNFINSFLKKRFAIRGSKFFKNVSPANSEGNLYKKHSTKVLS